MGNTVGSRQYPTDAYLAGFLDGDGSIVATLEKYNSKRFPYRVRIKINFSQHTKYIALLQRIQKSLDGVGTIRTNQKKQLSELVIQNRVEVQVVLVRLMPFLLIKKERAKIALQVLKLLSKNEKHKPSMLSDGAYTRVLFLVQNIRNENSHTGGKRNTIA